MTLNDISAFRSGGTTSQPPKRAGILLVDDHPENLIALEAILDSPGYEIVRAGSGEEALRCVLNREFAVILLDVQMPGMDGFETATLLRERDQCKHTPIIFVTAINRDEAHRFRGYAVGAVDYILKPIEPDILKSKVAVFVDLFQLREQVNQQAETLRQLEQVAHERRLTEVRREMEEEARRRSTEREQQARQLESLSVLAGGIAHDFNNLLQVILGHAGLVRKLVEAPSSANASAQQIETAALRAAELTKQMLAYSGRSKFVVQPLDLSRQLAEMNGQLAGAVPDSIVLHLDLATEPPLVEADAMQMRHLMANLISNAVEAIGKDRGKLTIRTGTVNADRAYLNSCHMAEELDPGIYTYIEVEDSGCGMPSSVQSRVFDPFFSTKFTGRGLGLSAVLGIVRGHHGTIRVSSDPGSGTCIRVLFPSLAAPIASPPVVVAEAPGAEGAGSTVLVVDDEASVREIATLMLQEHGFRVFAAAGGREGVELFTGHADEIDVVLLDLVMPDMDGEQTCRAIRRIRPDVPVVLSSGYGEEELTGRFAPGELAGFIQKPYQLASLGEKLATLASSRPRRQ